MAAAPDADGLTRRRAVAAGLTVIMGLTWVVISQFVGIESLGGGGGQQPEGPAGTPVGQTPAGQTPVGQTPVGQTPVGQTPVGQTPVGEPQPPDLLLVNLLSDWQQTGDVETNAIEQISQGEPAVIGYRYEAWAHGVEGQQQLTIIIEAADDTQRSIVDRNTGTNGPVIREGHTQFPTDDWSTGTKEATVTIRDEVTGFVSEPETTTFNVV